MHLPGLMTRTILTAATAAVSALLTACGAGVAMEEHAPVLGEGTVCFDAQGGGQCPSDMAWAEGETLHLLRLVGYLGPTERLPAHVEVQPVDVWTEWATPVTGIAPVSVIKVGPSMLSLTHEALHIVDFAHGSVGTIAHEGWSTNGHRALSVIFTAALWLHQGRPELWFRAAGSSRWLNRLSVSADTEVICGPTAGMPKAMLDAVLADAPTHEALTAAREQLCPSWTERL